MQECHPLHNQVSIYIRAILEYSNTGFFHVVISITPNLEVSYLFHLQVSGEKIKQISEAWVLESHRKSGSGGIEDYLDPKTLQHLEDLNIIDPQTTDRTLEPEPPPMPTKEILSGIADLTNGREKSGMLFQKVAGGRSIPTIL